jgi:serine/threonine-protein kinase
LPPPPIGEPPVAAASNRRDPTTLALAGGLALVATAAAAILLWPDAEPDLPRAETPAAIGQATVQSGAAVSPQSAVLQALPTIDCSWLNLTSATGEAGALALLFQGAAGRPVRAQNQIEQAAERAGGRVAQLDFSAVAQVNANLCGPVQAFSLVRESGAQRLSMPAQTVWEVAPQQLESGVGLIYAQPLIEVNIGNPSQDFALLGFEGASGKMEPIITSRAQFDATESSAITRLPNDRFRLNIATNHLGWSGVMLVTGRPPFETDLLIPADGGSAGWAQRFAERAAERGWKTEMIWYKVVDEEPNGEGAATASVTSATQTGPDG